LTQNEPAQLPASNKVNNLANGSRHANMKAAESGIAKDGAAKLFKGLKGIETAISQEEKINAVHESKRNVRAGNSD
jgi:hypothetical protein